MRAILIDPFKRTVEEIDTPASLDDMYQVLGVDLITVVRWDKDHALIIDDEGLLKDKETMEYFWTEGSLQPFAGRGLILGDEYGENRAATLDLDSVKNRVVFLDKANIEPEDWTGWTIIGF